MPVEITAASRPAASPTSASRRTSLTRWLTMVSGSATRTNATGPPCTATAAYSVSTPVVWLRRANVPSPTRVAARTSSRVA